MHRDTAIPLAGLLALFAVGVITLWLMYGPSDPARVDRVDAPSSPVVDPEAALATRHEVRGRVEAPEGAASLVLVVLGAARQDQLSPYGGPAELTPWMGELARAGARFADPIATGGWAQPSAFTLATGFDALALGAVDTAPRTGHNRIPAEVPTLAERLADAGWYTLGVNAIPHTGSSAGLGRGFDHFRDCPGSYDFDQRLTADQAVDIARGMLMSRTPDERQRPFFLQLTLADLHKPIDLKPADFQRWTGPDHSIAPYRAQLHRVDQALARLDRALPADTYLVVVGTTGEGLSMPSHHGHANGRNLYPSTAHVPWLLKGPEIEQGVVVQGLASQLDVLPTLLGLLGQAGDPGLPGHDLSALARAGGTTDRAEAIVDTWFSRANRAALYTPARACIADFGSAPREGEAWQDACFDRAADPDFLQPLDDPTLLRRLRQWREQTPGSALRGG